MVLTAKQHRWIYLFCLGIIAIGLPFSRVIISVGEVLLALNFILEGRWNERLQKLRTTPSIWLFVGVFLMYAMSLLWSDDLDSGLGEIRLRLPLLLFPIVIPLSQKLKRSEFLWIGALFSAAVIGASIFSTYTYFITRGQPGFEFREISLFTSHIRYSLMVCLSYLILLNCAWNEEKKPWLRVAYVILTIWMSLFVFILQSMTGIIVWLLCSYMLLFYTVFYLKEPVLRATANTVLLIAPLFIGLYLIFQIDAFYPDKQLDFSNLDTHTAEGTRYQHDTNTLTLENGHYINLYIAPSEIEREWNKVSDIPYFNGQDNKGQYVYTTLIRYMTSKGLRKDAEGFRKLTEEDIYAIENGVANTRFLYGNALDNRIYTVIWEFDKMIQDKNVQGHSVTQRFEFWRTATQIFSESPIIGVGAGDVLSKYDETYEKQNTRLAKRYRLKAHNQYLSILVAVGLIGLMIFLASIITPFLTINHANSFLYIGFCIILFSSMVNEDTLSTQIGITLYAFFNSFLLYSLSALPRKTRL